MQNKRMIWSYLYDEEDFAEILEEKGIDPGSCEAQRICSELNQEQLECEITNLDIPLEGKILVFGTLGLWNGQSRFYTMLEQRNVSAIFTGNYDSEWYIEDGEVRCDAHHHDGVNHYTYRVITDADRFEEVLSDSLIDGNYTGEQLDSCTRSLAKDIAEVYGIEV